MVSNRPSFYVKRSNGQRTSWTGPIRSQRQVERERDAWIEAGWTAEVVVSTPQVRAEVRAWMREVAAR